MIEEAAIKKSVKTRLIRHVSLVDSQVIMCSIVKSAGYKLGKKGVLMAWLVLFKLPNFGNPVKRILLPTWKINFG